MRAAVFALCVITGCAAPSSDAANAAPPAPEPAKAVVSVPEPAPPDPNHEPAAVDPSDPPPLSPGGTDYAPDLAMLFRVAACGGDSGVPPRLPATVVSAHCARLAKYRDRYKARWLDRANPFFREVVPRDLPRTIVYPFGGGDLLTALAVYPEAREITTMSLEHIGDPRELRRMKRDDVIKYLDMSRTTVRRLFREGHSTTDTLRIISKSRLPGELVFALVALTLHGYEPVSLRYFRLADDGSIEYVDDAEVAFAERGAKGKAKRRRLRKARVFANAELAFRPAGKPNARPRVWRHIAANLDDEHLAARPGLLAHLERKGRVAAMTKAASYLLWLKSFSTIRQYLLGHTEYMVSDSSGIPPRFADPAGFAQDTYGVFEGPYFSRGRRYLETEFKSLWRDNPSRDVPMRFGYPDANRNSHLMITRRVVKPPPKRRARDEGG